MREEGKSGSGSKLSKIINVSKVAIKIKLN
jgi:hypothetical protein